MQETFQKGYSSFLVLRIIICSTAAKVNLTSIIEVNIYLGAQSKNFVGIELDWSVTLGSVTLVRVKSARVTAIWIGDRYMR